MRAILEKQINPNLGIGNRIIIKGANAHHIAGVARIRKGEAVLVLNGNGLMITTFFKEGDKKEVVLEVMKIETVEKNDWIDLAICLPKKEAYESIIKEAVEMGVTNIYPVKAAFSQKVNLKEDRLEKIIESATIQSNNPYLINIHEDLSFDDLVMRVKKYDQVFLFSTSNHSPEKLKEIKKKKLIIIGPEGGLSNIEERTLISLSNIHLIKLDIPIMRSTTAASSALGYVLGAMDALR